MAQTTITEQEQRLVKAAALGFATSLANSGYDEETIKKATAIYTDAENGTIVKKAARIQRIDAAIMQALQKK